MTNKYKASVCLISWGATIQSIKVPGRDGKLVDIVLGFDDIDGKNLRLLLTKNLLYPCVFQFSFS